eukprot:738275-Prorocentrum_minimum.AAC.2
MGVRALETKHMYLAICSKSGLLYERLSSLFAWFAPLSLVSTIFAKPPQSHYQIALLPISIVLDLGVFVRGTSLEGGSVGLPGRHPTPGGAIR